MDYLIDNLENSAGKKHRYQLTVLLFSCSIWIAHSLMVNAIPFFEERPMVIIHNKSKGTDETIKMTRDLCKDYNSRHESNTFEYTVIDLGTSVATEFEFFCDEHMLGIMNLVSFSGCMFGYIANFLLNNKFGRHPTLITALILNIFSSLFVIFIRNWYTVLVCFFFFNLSGYISTFSTYLYTVEIVSNDRRSLYGAINNNSNNLSVLVCLSSLLFFKSWRSLFYVSLIMSVCLLVFLYKYIIESPKTFLRKRKYEKYMASLNYIADFNGRKKEFDRSCNVGTTVNEDNKLTKTTSNMESDVLIDPIDLNEIRHIIGESKDEYQRPWTHIFKFRSQRYKFLILSHCLFTVIGMSYTNSINFKNFEVNIYTLGFINIGVECISHIIMPFLMDLEFMGRKYSNIGYSAGVAMATATIMIFPLNESSIIAFSFIAKFFLGGMGVSIYCTANEAYPNSIKNTSFAINCVLGKVGVMALTYSNEVLSNHSMNIIFLVNSLAMCLFLFYIDETLNKPLQIDVPEVIKTEDSSIMLEDSSKSDTLVST